MALFSDAFEPWVVMILPSGGFFTLAGLLLVIRWFEGRRATAAPAVMESAR
jgi:electron transport complex protein RnfE